MAFTHCFALWCFHVVVLPTPRLEPFSEKTENKISCPCVFCYTYPEAKHNGCSIIGSYILAQRLHRLHSPFLYVWHNLQRLLILITDFLSNPLHTPYAFLQLFLSPSTCLASLLAFTGGKPPFKIRNWFPPFPFTSLTLALHLVLPSPATCFYPGAVLSFPLTGNE